MAIIEKNLKETLTSDGTTTDTLAADGAVTLVLDGNFGGGDASMEISYDAGATWLTCVDLTNTPVTFSSNAYITHTSETEALYRVSLSGSTSPSLNVQILIG